MDVIIPEPGRMRARRSNAGVRYDIRVILEGRRKGPELVMMRVEYLAWYVHMRCYCDP